MRDNKDRLGISNPNTDNFADLNEKKSLNFVTPTEFVELPSKGRFYPEDHPLKGKEEIEIKFMTSHEEDLLTSKSLLKKGIAIDRVLQSLLVGKFDLDSLFICDKNALIIAARISGYGSDYTVKVLCPNCEETIENTFNLDELKIFEGDMKILDVNGQLTIKLPKTQVEVGCRLLTGRDEKFLNQLMESKKRHKLPESFITDQLKMFVVSINGVVEQEEIYDFLEKMPSVDSRYLRKVYQNSIPSVDLTQKIMCSQCDTESEVMMPLGITFFWPK